MSVILFFVVLFVLILVHEWGHFIVAKKTGMRVDEFGIGFPPKLFGVKKGETEYTFNALPIGGFVKILGENAEEATDPMDVDRTFSSKSKWAQAAVLVAGVTMNVIFAWFLFALVFMIGVTSVVTPEEATDAAELTVTNVLAETPAFNADITPGSVITSVVAGADTRLTDLTPTGFSAFIAEQGRQSLAVTFVEGEGDPRTVTVIPQTGLIPDDAERPAVGVSLALTEHVSHGLFSALWLATERTVTALGAITVGLTSFIIDAFTFQADLEQVAGPVGIVGLVGDAAEFGFTALLMFTAFISLNLAVINMLPFPALDGGRLLMVAIEAVIKRPLNPEWVGRLNLVGFALLLLLMVVVTVSDVGKLL